MDGGEIPIGICAKLREPIDWKLWEHTLLAHAHLLGIQDYVTEGKPSMKVPVEPNIHDIMYEKNASALRLDPDIRAKVCLPLQISDLTPKSAAQFAKDQDIFHARMKQFFFYQPLLKRLSRWIISTTSPIIFSLCCKANEDVHQWYMSLKRHFEGLLENERLMVDILMGRMVSECQDQPRTVEEARQWLDKWEDTMEKAHMVGYEVSDFEFEFFYPLFSIFKHLRMPQESRKVLSDESELDVRSYKRVASRMRLLLAEKEEKDRVQAEEADCQDSAPSDGGHRANNSHKRRGGRRNQRRGGGRN